MLDGWRAAGHRPCRRSRSIRPSGKPVEGVRDGHRLRRGRAAAEARGARLQAAEARRDRAASCAAADRARRSSSRSSPASKRRACAQRFPGRRRDRPGDAQPAGRGPPRRGRPLQRRRRRRSCGSSSATCSRRSASRCGWRTRRSSPRSARSPAPARPMSRASSPRWPRPARSAGSADEIAATIALETVLGTAWMAATTRRGHGRRSRRRVASPKGTTEAGLAVLDHDHVLDAADRASRSRPPARRGAELAEEAQGAPSLAEDERLP